VFTRYLACLLVLDLGQPRLLDLAAQHGVIVNEGLATKLRVVEGTLEVMLRTLQDLFVSLAVTCCYYSQVVFANGPVDEVVKQVDGAPKAGLNLSGSALEQPWAGTGLTATQLPSLASAQPLQTPKLFSRVA
jgi:hypothetical protein